MLKKRISEFETELMMRQTGYEIALDEEKLRSNQLSKKLRLLVTRSEFSKLFDEYEEEVQKLYDEILFLKQENSQIASELERSNIESGDRQPARPGRSGQSPSRNRPSLHSSKSPCKESDSPATQSQWFKKLVMENRMFVVENSALRKRERTSILNRKFLEDSARRISSLNRELQEARSELAARGAGFEDLRAHLLICEGSNQKLAQENTKLAVHVKVLSEEISQLKVKIDDLKSAAGGKDLDRSFLRLAQPQEETPVLLPGSRRELVRSQAQIEKQLNALGNAHALVAFQNLKKQVEDLEFELLDSKRREKECFSALIRWQQKKIQEQ